MNTRSVDSEAFCLHVRPYRESSAIVQLFTKQSGKISAIAKGIKSTTKLRSSHAALLQPFNALRITWIGKNNLKTITHVELISSQFSLKQRQLLAGMYVNELLTLVLPEHLEHGELYEHYQLLLSQLVFEGGIEEALRRFEYQLLEHLGYGLSFCEVDEHGHSLGQLKTEGRYSYRPESGFLATTNKLGPDVFSGEALLRFANNDLTGAETLATAKSVMRLATQSLLGGKILNSRQLFF